MLLIMEEDENKIIKTSAITVNVGTNINNVPVRMKWTAEDGNIENQEAGAMFLSLWDPKDKNTMKIDLWTKDLSVEEMKQFFHQTLLTMADTFEKATGETRVTEDLRDYCYHFADKMKILPEE
jgi:gliding motility-associated protein GldC